jgi:hypothetical protein
MRDSERDVAGHLSERVRAALADAERTVSQSEMLASARRIVRQPDSMVTRCAWCGRLQLGGHWTLVDQAPSFFKDFVDRSVTHGICGDCMRGLESSGKTSPLQE